MTREKIKAAALELFAQHGFAGTTLNQIAEKVGIKAPSLFSHFKGKEELFLTIFQEVNQQIVEHVRLLVSGQEEGTVAKRLELIFRRNCQFYMENEARTRFLKQTMVTPPPFGKEAILNDFFEAEQQLSATLTELFCQGVAEGVLSDFPVERFLAAYYCMTDGVLMQINIYEPGQMEERIGHIWEHFWRGVKA